MALDKLTKVQSVGISSFIQVVGVVTATGGFVGDVTGTTSNASGATGDFSISDKIVHTGDTDTAIRFPAADTFTVETGGSEALRITSGGLVGIGTDIPESNSRLHTFTTQTTARTITETSSASGYAGYRLTNGTGYWEMQVDGSNQGLRFLDDGTERLRITSAGHVNIGGASPSSTALTVKMATNKHIGFSPLQSEVGNVPALVAFQDSGSLADIGFRGTTFRVATGNSERLRIASNGLVGIGTDNPTKALHLSQNSDIAIRMDSNNSNANARTWEIVVGGNASNNAEMVFRTRQDDGTGGSECARIKRNGIIALPSGGGIDFASTSDASGMSSELLDDYEEGTWTPALIGSSSNPSLTYGSQAGAYEKIGTLVHASFFMQISGVTSQGSGQLRIGGLPYTSVAGIAGGEVPGVLLQAEPFNDGKGANRQQIVRTASQNYLLVGYRDLTSANVPIPTNGAANVGTGYFIGHITYRAS